MVEQVWVDRAGVDVIKCGCDNMGVGVIEQVWV